MNAYEIQVTAKDFKYLASTSMQWFEYANDWRVKREEGRFNPKPHLNWEWAYWYETYSDLILARTFLQINEHAYFVIFDEVIEQWMILTDYSEVN
jgi:hypothetical protein